MTRKLIPPTLGRCKGLSPIQNNSSISNPPNDAPITEFEYDNSAASPADASDSVDILGATTKGFPLDDAISIVENTMQSDNTRHAQDVEMIDQVAALVEDYEDLRDDLSQDRDDNVALTLDTREDEDGEYEDGVFSDNDDRDGGDAQGNTQRKEESQTTSATRRTSVIDIDPTTEVPHYTKPFSMSPFNAAIRLFVQKWDVTREQWVDFRSMLHLLQNVPPEVAALPARVDTLKANLDQQLPLITIRSRELDLDVNLLQTRSGQNPKRRKEEIGLFDMKAFFRSLLQADTIMKRAHIGMAAIVDQPTEFWHSNSWGGSNRTTSGCFAKVQSGKYKGDIVLVSDFVWYHTQKGTRSIGRVTFVGVEERLASRTDKTFGKIKLRLQPVCSRRQVDELHWQTIDRVQLRSGEEELFLVEDADPLYVTEDELIRHDNNVHIDYNFSTSIPSTPSSKRFCVRYIFNIKSNTLRPVALSHPLRGELEIIEFDKIGYNRTTMIRHLDSATKTIVSFPYTLFIDSFGLYRNMYRPIPGFYAQFAFLNELDRKKRINVFPVTLAPFAAKWDEVIDSLLHLKELEVGVEVTLDDGSTVTVCAPCLAYVGDMPQQQGNAGCKNQKADHFCRSCLISSSDNANDIRYDIITYGRYHNETIRVREEAKKKSKKDQTQIFKNLGLNDQPSPLTRLTPSLCIPLAFPGDVAHSEFKGIARQVLNLLFTDIIKTSFHEAFARSFAATPPPQGWATIQNLNRYIGSFSMQEFGRAITIVPITLRKWLSDIRVRPKYLAAIEFHLESEECTYKGEFYSVDFLVHCYATISRLNAVIMGPYIRAQDRDQINELVIESRERMQDLLEIAVIAATTNQTSASTCTPKPSWQRRRTLSQTSQASCLSDLAERDAEAMDIFDLDSDDARFGDEEEVLVQTFGCRHKKVQSKEQEERETKRVEALRRKKFTPNVHTIRHVMDTITEYASARNVTTWSGEDRHK